MTATLSVTAFSTSENSSTPDVPGSTTAPSTENYMYYYYDLPESDIGPCVYERHGALFLPALYSIFFLFGLFGNSLVIWVISLGVRLRSMTDVCLLNLAIADLLLMCSLPFLAYQAHDQWLFGEGMCKMVLGIYNVVFYCGIFFVTLMSIDRYLAIVHAVYALKIRTKSFGMVAAAVVWVAGFMASFPDLIFLKQQTSGNMTYCFPEYPSANPGDAIVVSPHFWRVFSLFKMNIIGLIIPAIVICFCYSRIIWRLLFSQRSKKQAIRLVVIVVAAFFSCWIPYNFASFFKALELLHVYTQCESSKAIRLALQVTEVIALSHSCLNPFLYVFVGEKFRRHLIKLVNKTPCKLCQMVKVYIPQGSRVGSTYSQTTSMDERSTGV